MLGLVRVLGASGRRAPLPCSQDHALRPFDAACTACGARAAGPPGSPRAPLPRPAAWFALGFFFFPLPELLPRHYWLFHSLWHCCLAAGHYQLCLELEEAKGRPPRALAKAAGRPPCGCCSGAGGLGKPPGQEEQAC